MACFNLLLSLDRLEISIVTIVNYMEIKPDKWIADLRLLILELKGNLVHHYNTLGTY